MRIGAVFARAVSAASSVRGAAGERRGRLSAARPSVRAGLLLGTLLLPAAAQAEVPRVVTDIAPVQSLVAQVMGDLGQPALLMDQGADAHHFALRPSQARALQGADLLVWIGPEMTPWLETALAGAESKRSVLGLLAAEGTLRREFGASGPHEHVDHPPHDGGGHDHDNDHDHEEHDHAEHAGHDHAHDHDHDHDHTKPDHEGADHGHEGHDHSGTDPHAWLDPANAIAWLDLIAAELARLDPENAAQYRDNALAARRDLVELDARIAAELAPHAKKPFVVAHDAYGYFTSHFGLTQIGAIAGGDATTPGAARLRALREELAQAGAVCAFPEVGRDAGMVALVVEGSATRLGNPLDPEGRAAKAGPGLYAELLIQLSGALVDCLERKG